MVDPVCGNLATKAELQELRDQLNEVLGKTEDGSTQVVFEQERSPTATFAALASTVFLLTSERARNAVVDIIFDNPINEPIYRDLASRRAQIMKVKGSGARTPLPDLSKIGQVAGQGAGGAAAASAAAATATASMALLVGLVNIIGTLALNIATVKILDKRIDAEARATQKSLDNLNNGMLRLYEKNQGDIAAVQQELNANEAVALQNRQTIEDVRFKTNEALAENSRLDSELDSTQTSIEQLQTANQTLAQQITDYNADYAETTQNLTETITKVDEQLQTSLEIIEKQKLQIEEANTEIELVNQKTDDIEDRVLVIEREVDELKIEFSRLEQDLTEEVELIDARTKKVEGRLTILEKKATVSGGGAPIGIVQNTATTQNKTLELTKQLSNSDVELVEITPQDVLNQSDYFQNTIDNLLNDIPNTQVEEQQLQDLRTNINTDLTQALTSLTAVVLSPGFDTITQQTSTDAIIDGTEQGICKSLNDPSCPATSSNPNPTQGLKGLGDAIRTRQDSLAAALAALNNLLNTQILNVVKNTNQAVRSTQYGLEKIQSFASTAWEVTKADKIIAVANLMASVHNAAMLSRNLGQTLGDVASQSLTLFGVKAPDGSAIDVNSVIGNSITGLITSVIGVEAYQGISERWTKANRILTAASGTIYALRGMKDAVLEAHEVVGGWVAKIGNGMQDQGILQDRTFPWMNPGVNFRNPFSRFTTRIDNLEDAASQVNSLVSSGVEFQESVNETITSSTELATALDNFNDERETEQATAETTNASPTINNSDLVKAQTNN